MFDDARIGVTQEGPTPTSSRGLLPRIFAGSSLARENVTGLINLFSKDVFKADHGGADLALLS